MRTMVIVVVSHSRNFSLNRWMSSVMGGVDLNTVRELLGHKSVAMTLRYAHLAPEHTAAVVETLVARRAEWRAV
jgi:site-specific recombinase XerC